MGTSTAWRRRGRRRGSLLKGDPSIHQSSINNPAVAALIAPTLSSRQSLHWGLEGLVWRLEECVKGGGAGFSVHRSLFITAPTSIIQS